MTLASGSYVVFYCPLPDCPWQMRETPADQVPLAGSTLDEAIRNGILAAKAAEEETLRAHLAEHPIEEWAAAVVDLDRRARVAERAGEVVATAERWKAQLPQGAIKGVTEADAARLSATAGAAVMRQTVTLYADGGEYLSPWEPARLPRDDVGPVRGLG